MYTVSYIRLQHQMVFLDHNIPFSSKSSYMISNGNWSSSIDAINRVVTVQFITFIQQSGQVAVTKQNV